MKPVVLIVDDSAMNRMVLSDMLEDSYEILEAPDGADALTILYEQKDDIALVLLDIMMPKVDGIEVLEAMNRQRLIGTIPVIVVSGESEDAIVSKAFDLGATDYLNRNFDARIVKRRVENSIMLYSRQKRLVDMVADQIYERERSNSLMVSMLSHIVEFRNQESGMHVQNIRRLTETLFHELAAQHPELEIDSDYISTASMASALHDIGKIAIPEEIMNKPGRFTDEEYEIMKTHSMEGANMLAKMPNVQDEPLVKMAYEITRWHHERYDGRGYPDGLAGDDIPMSAQVVSLADVYDALTAKRVYKDPFPHEKAMEMILNGECGQFNPLLLDCLKALDTQLQDVMDTSIDEAKPFEAATRIADALQSSSDLTPVNRTLQMLESEKEKYQFFTSMSQEVHFEYFPQPGMIVFQETGAKLLGLPKTIYDPLNDERLVEVMGGREVLEMLVSQVKLSTPISPIVEAEVEIDGHGESRRKKIVLRVAKDPDTGELESILGKLLDQYDKSGGQYSGRPLDCDALTGLNHAESFYELAESALTETTLPYAMVMVDVDNFKDFNERYGHEVGNSFLRELADRLRYTLRVEDLIARIGGDEFLVLAQLDKDHDMMVRRLKDNLCVKDGQGVEATVSIGISYTEDAGRDYSALFNECDKALFAAKGQGKNCCVVYDDSLADIITEGVSKINDDALHYSRRRSDKAPTPVA